MKTTYTKKQIDTMYRLNALVESYDETIRKVEWAARIEHPELEEYQEDYVETRTKLLNAIAELVVNQPE